MCLNMNTLNEQLVLVARFRASIEAVRADDYEVYFVDFGNRQLNGPSTLCPLPSRLAVQPCLAHQVKLQGHDEFELLDPSSLSQFVNKSYTARVSLRR